MGTETGASWKDQENQWDKTGEVWNELQSKEEELHQQFEGGYSRPEPRE